jgi:hypothetical protein
MKRIKIIKTVINSCITPLLLVHTDSAWRIFKANLLTKWINNQYSDFSLPCYCTVERILEACMCPIHMFRRLVVIQRDFISEETKLFQSSWNSIEPFFFTWNKQWSVLRSRLKCYIHISWMYLGRQFSVITRRILNSMNIVKDNQGRLYRGANEAWF